MEKTAIVLNDQLGRGRSSNTAAIVVLIRRWLRRETDERSPTTPARRNASRKSLLTPGTSKTSWQVINSCLRVIRNGLEVKRVSAGLILADMQIVDAAIDSTSATYNLRDAIEDFRDRAEEASTEAERNRAIEAGES